jgi:tRNA (cmo5U34)-methyltransferase
MYDRTIDLVVPRYRHLHNKMIGLLKNHFKYAGHSEPSVVLDIGSGTGTETIGILEAIKDVRVVAVDLCPEIQEVHRRRMQELDRSARTSLTRRCSLVCGDVLTDLKSAKAVLRLLPEDSPALFSVIVTSLTVHHFSHRQKQQFYHLVRGLLKPGGLFVNADLFSYANAESYAKALQFDLNWMRAQFEKPSKAFAQSRELSLARRKELLDLWIKHYELDNRLEPIEDPLTGRRRRVGQARMLEKAGFRDIRVAYRFSLSGILVAHRSDEGISKPQEPAVLATTREESRRSGKDRLTSRRTD